MLRSLRLGEADRVLHLYTLERGRVGAVAKGVRRTKSRFGARLEPLSHVELLLHQGGGELHTVTGVDLVQLAPRGARGRAPPRSRARRARGDAQALPRAGGEPARLHGADALPGGPRRGRAGRRRARPRSARALVPAQAAVAVGLPAAPDELRRVRLRERAGRFLAPRRRRGVRGVRERSAAALRRRDRRDRGAARAAARRGRRRAASRAARRPKRSAS